MLVDGGHGFDVALSDIRHLARVSSQPHNVIVVDDINSRPVRTAWNVARRSGVVQQIFSCTFGNNGRAFATGVVVGGQKKNYSRRHKPRTAQNRTRLSCSLHIRLSIVGSAVAVMALCAGCNEATKSSSRVSSYSTLMK